MAWTGRPSPGGDGGRPCGRELSLASFDLPLYQRFSLLTETTCQQASAEHGVPLELLMVVREVENALGRSGLRSSPARPPAMCFLDISGYTRLTEERGDEAAAELAGRLSRLVQQTAERHRGKVVRWLGDGVMIYFREPGQGVLAALQMMEEVTDAGLPPAHVGLHAGPVVFQGGDYYGRTRISLRWSSPRSGRSS